MAGRRSHRRPLRPTRSGATLRYGLVIGVDRGDRARGLLELSHAERDAGRLHYHLIEYGRFDRAHTSLLLAPPRQAVLDAAAALKAQIARDRRRSPEVQITLGLFYSGHGLPGEVLVADGSLTAEDIREIFAASGADLALGFFDTCRAGSLSPDPAQPARKGIEVQPGFNPITALPEPGSFSRGVIMMMSSASDQPSYEDPTLGGVFTHYFTKAFIEADEGKGAVTLDAMWRYTAARVKAHTAGLHQKPERYAHIRQQGTLFFGFRPRNARLRVFPGITADVMLRYPELDLAEHVRVIDDQITIIPTYAGRVEVLPLDESGAMVAPLELSVEPQQVVDIRPATLAQRPTPPGYTRQRLRTRGVAVEQVHPDWQIELGLAYRQVFAPATVISADYEGLLEARLSRGALTLSGAALAGGRPTTSPSTWGDRSYRVERLGGLLTGGAGWALGQARLDIELGLGARSVRQRFTEGVSARAGSSLAEADHTRWQGFGMARARISSSLFGLEQVRPVLMLDLELSEQAHINPGQPAGPGLGVSPSAALGLSWHLGPG